MAQSSSISSIVPFCRKEKEHKLRAPQWARAHATYKLPIGFVRIDSNRFEGFCRALFRKFLVVIPSPWCPGQKKNDRTRSNSSSSSSSDGGDGNNSKNNTNSLIVLTFQLSCIFCVWVKGNRILYDHFRALRCVRSSRLHSRKPAEIYAIDIGLAFGTHRTYLS